MPDCAEGALSLWDRLLGEVEMTNKRKSMKSLNDLLVIKPIPAIEHI
jgi:hypothetical protein